MKREYLKRTKQGLLVLVLFLSVLIGDIGKVQAEEAFSLAKYIAGRWSDEKNSEFELINDLRKWGMPSNIIYEELKDNSSFQNGLKGWKDIQTLISPSEYLEGKLDLKGYYHAVILSVFIKQKDSSSYGYDIAKNVTTETKRLLSVMKTWVDASDKLEKKGAIEYLNINKDLTAEEKDEIMDFIMNDFKENHPHLEAMGSITKVVAEVFESVDMLADAITTLVCYLELAEASEGTRMIIAEMLERCPESNDLLKNALQEIYNATEGYETAVQTVLFNTTGEGIVKVIGNQLDMVWENTVSLVPYANAFMVGGKIGEKIGSGISNSLFSTEKFFEVYYKAQVLSEVYDLLDDIYVSSREEYLATGSTESAVQHISVVGEIYHAAEVGCDIGIEFIKAIDSAALGWTIYDEEECAEQIKKYTSIKDSLISLEKGLWERSYVELFDQNRKQYYEVFPEGRGEVEASGTCGDTITWSLYTDGTLRFSGEGEMWDYSSLSENGYYLGISTPWYERKSDIYNVSFAENITYIGQCAFDDCKNIMNINLPTNLKQIGVGAMADTAITEIVLPKGVVEIGRSAFAECTVLARIVLSDELEIIGEYAFRNCESLMEVVLPERLHTIGRYAFSGCEKLERINIPYSITKIPGDCFGGCVSLSEIELHENIVSIGGGAFRECISLTEVEIPLGIQEIGSCAFQACENLKQVVIPTNGGIKSFGRFTFERCKNLERVEIGEGITVIEYGAFEGCYALSEIIIPKTVVCIEEEAFSHCSSLKEIIIPEGIASIGRSAFQYSGLVKLVLPSSLIELGNYAFSGTQLHEIIIPEGITSIGEATFYYCHNLKNVVFPSTITELGFMSFDDCSSLEKLVIPTSVNKIAQFALYSCDSLKELHFEGEMPDDGADREDVLWLNEQNDGVAIYYPAGYDSWESIKVQYDNLIWIGVGNEVTIGSMEGGIATTNLEIAGAGAIVNLEAIANEGYNFKEWVVEEGNITLENPKGAITWFEMPGEVVKLKAVFERDTSEVPEDNIGADLAGYTLSLNGNVGVNFYMELEEEILNDSEAYMLFNLPNGNTEQMLVEDAGKNTTLVDGKTFYVFSCEVASYEMTQDIKVQMFDGAGNSGKEYSYKAKDYAEYIINNEAKYSADDVAFAKAMLNYGACAQSYFEVSTDDLANKNLSAADQLVTPLSASDLEEYKASATRNELGTFAGYSLTLKSETTLKAYFEPAEGIDVNDLTFTAAGQKIVPQKSGNYYVLSVEKIKAWNLDKLYTFKVSDGNREIEFSCSALSYGYSVLNKGNSVYPDTLIQLISALRLYQQKSEIYGSGNN